MDLSLTNRIKSFINNSREIHEMDTIICDPYIRFSYDGDETIRNIWLHFLTETTKMSVVKTVVHTLKKRMWLVKKLKGLWLPDRDVK